MGIFDYIDEEEFDFWQKQRKADRWAQDDATSRRYAQPGPFDDGFQQAQRMEPLRTLQPAPMPVPEPEPVVQPSPEWNQGSRSYGQPGPFDVPQERVRRSVEPEPPQPTGDILGNAFRAAQRQPKRDLLTEIGDIARGLGHDDDAARVAQAIARTEGALEGQVGDTTLPGGGSHGPFQFYGKYGMLPAYAKSLGVSEDQAAEYARANPQHAARWALQGYLGQAIKEGQAKGLRGADLATYAQTHGQRSQSPERAGQNYQVMFGGRVSPVMQGQARQEPLRTLQRPAEERMPERDPLKEFGDYAGGLVDNITKGVSGLFDRRPEAPQAAGPKKPDFLTSFAQDQARIAREAREARAARGEMLPYERRLPTQEEGPRPIDQIGADLGGALTGTLQASMPALEAAFNAAEWLDMTFLRGLLKAGAQLNPTDPRFRASWLDRQEYERMTKPMLEGGFTAAVTRLIPEGAPRKVAARIGEGLSGGFHAAQLEDIRQKQRLPEEEYTTWRAEQDQKAAKEWERWATEEENPLVGMVASIVNPIGWVVGPVEAVQAGKMLYSAAKGSRAVQTAGRGLKRAGQVFMEGAKDTPIGLTVEDVGKVPLATQPAPTFYSQLERTLADAKQPKWRPGDLRGYLRAAGVKDEELKWTGFDDYLQERANAKQSVTKDEALQFVKDNQVEVKEVVYPSVVAQEYEAVQKLAAEAEQRYRSFWQDARQRYGSDITQWPQEAGAELRRLGIEQGEAGTRARQLGSRPTEGNATKFSEKQLPGGENYRELLLTLPEKGATQADFVAWAQKEYPRAFSERIPPSEREEWLQMAQDRWSRLVSEDKRLTMPRNYYSVHFKEYPNVLAHVRFNDRVDAAGKKVLFVEEVQSDWHQTGRSKGYASDKARLQAERQALGDSQADVARYNQITDEIGKFRDAVPSAPFSKTWPELAMKRVIRWAADNGYDRVAWTTGEQQAERYDLSKQVQSIAYQRYGKSPTSGVAAGEYHLEGKLLDGRDHNFGTLSEQELPNVVGKELAQKIVADADSKGADASGLFAGIDLKVGGQGMLGFYDQILPEMMNKLGKKFGARVGETRIGVAKLQGNRYFATGTGDGRFVVWDEVGQRYADRIFTTQAEAETHARQLAKTGEDIETVHAIDITPSMRESVITKGQPLFMAPEAVGGVGGGIYGLATDDPNLSDRERADELGKKIAGGILIGRVATKGLKGVRPGLTVEDVGKGMSDKGYVLAARGVQDNPALRDIVERTLARAQERGSPALVIDDLVYLSDGKYAIRIDTGSKGRFELQKLHDLSPEGLLRGLESGYDPSGEWSSFNRKAQEVVEQAKAKRAEEAAARETQQLAERETKDKAQQAYNTHRQGLDEQLKTTRFAKSTQTIKVASGQEIEISGPSIGGLIVHKAIGPHQKDFYTVTHASSGMILSGDFVTQAQAKVAAMRLAQVFDWTRPLAEVTDEVKARVWPLSKAMRSGDPYALVEGAPPLTPRVEPATLKPAEVEALPARREAAPSVEDVGKAPTAYVQARKQAGTGKYELFYRGTRNKVELTEGELFDSPQQATATYEARWYKERQAGATEAPPAVQAATPEPPATKQPWEMTLAEVNRTGYIGYDIGTNQPIVRPSSTIDEAANASEHGRIVAKALSEGKPVPDAVLKDYPDLAKAAPEPELKPPLTEPVPIKEKGVRFEAGKTLKPEERKEVIRSVVDVYRAKGAPKVTKGFDRNGDEIIGFEYSPDLFERSDITGKMVRYYIKLPDGRIAHPSELYPELTEAKIARAIEEEQASIKRAAKDAAYLQARRDARIVDAASGENQRTQANQKYAQTGRLRPYSYLAQDENGGIVRVDGMSQKDIDYYTSKGFVPITEPAKPDASDMGRFSRARQVIEANIEDVPPNVLADYPDLAAKTAPTTTEPLPADISKATAETLTEEATPPPVPPKTPIGMVDDAALTPEGAQPAEVRPRRPTMAERYEQWKATQPQEPAPAATAGAPPPEPPQGPPPTLPSGRQPGGPQNRRPYTPPDPYQQLQDALKPETQSLGQQLGERFNAFMRAMMDRNYDLGALEKATGIPVHKLAQVVSGAVAAGEDRVRRFVLPIVEPLGKDVKHLEEYMVLMRNGDILARNPSAQLPGGIPGWPGVLEAEKRLQARIGPERFAAVKAAAEQMWKVNDDWILKPLVDNGMLSTDSYRAIKSAHPHYIDFHRADFSLTDAVERGLARPEANVSNLGIKQMELAGSQRKLDQPLARTEAQIIRTRVLISRNRAARGIVEALQALEKEVPEVQRRVRLLSSKEAAEHSNVTDTISFFKEGQKVVYQVPPQFASIAKHVEAETVGAWWNLASQVLGASLLRKGAVQYNPLFVVVNPMRDAIGAFFREGLVPMSPDYIKGWVAAITQNSTFTDAAEAGVLMSGIVDTMRSTEALSRASSLGKIQVKSWEDALWLVPRLIQQRAWGDLLKLPPRLIERANIASEQATRIATYAKLRGQGIGELEAAIRARDVSVDFAKSGNVMKLINQMIPFSNAGLQGASNTVRLFKDNPKQALLASSLLAMPSIAAYTWNQRYESSKKIPEYEYINFWVLQVGEGMKNVDPKYPDQPAEKFPIYIRIPKGPTGAFVTAPVEMALRLAEAKGDASVQDQLLKGAWSMARSLSPIEPNLSGIVPPVGGTAIGISTGKDLFRGQDIVPRREENRPAELQYGSETSDVAVALGERFQMSPRMIEWAIKDVGAGVASQTMWVSDLVLNSLGYNPKAPGELKRQALTETEAISRNPIAGRFVGTRDTAEESANWDRFNKLVEDTNRAYASIPEVRRFGLTMGPVSESVSIDGKAQPYSWPERIKLQQDTFDTRKTGIDALTRSSLYAKADDAEKLELIQDVARKANEWAKANRPAAEMREYPTALEQRRQYKEIEPSVTGMTPEQLRLSGAFLRMKNDIAQTLPPLNNRSEFALRMAAERDPKGFEQYRLRMYIEKKIGKQLTMMKQDFWAKHPLLQKFFSDTPAQVPVKAAS